MLFGSPSAPQVGMFYRRCIRCCCFSVIVLRAFCAEYVVCVCVCVGCEVCFVVVYVRLFWVWFEQTDVLLFSMRFRCVVAREFGVIWMHSNCEPVLRNVASVVQL